MSADGVGAWRGVNPEDPNHRRILSTRVLLNRLENFLPAPFALSEAYHALAPHDYIWLLCGHEANRGRGIESEIE